MGGAVIAPPQGDAHKPPLQSRRVIPRSSRWKPTRSGNIWASPNRMSHLILPATPSVNGTMGNSRPCSSWRSCPAWPDSGQQGHGLNAMRISMLRQYAPPPRQPDCLGPCRIGTKVNEHLVQFRSVPVDQDLLPRVKTMFDIAQRIRDDRRFHDVRGEMALVQAPDDILFVPDVQDADMGAVEIGQLRPADSPAIVQMRCQTCPIVPIRSEQPCRPCHHGGQWHTQPARKQQGFKDFLVLVFQ